MFSFLQIIFVSLIPIVLWAYFFSFIDNNILNKKRFFIGVTAGILSVVPIFFMDKTLDFIQVPYFNTFFFATQIDSIASVFDFNISFALLLLFLLGTLFLFGFILYGFRNIYILYLKNIIGFVALIFVIGWGFYIIESLDLFEGWFEGGVTAQIGVGSIAFDSFKLIVFYYVIIAFLEESTKHFSFLQSSIFSIKTSKDAVLYAVFVAFGFSFTENILYLYYANKEGLVNIFLLRSLFTAMLHVLTSSIVAYFFSLSLLNYSLVKNNFWYLFIFLKGLFLGVGLHFIFNIFLSLGISWIIFIYIGVTYLFMSYVFLGKKNQK